MKSILLMFTAAGFALAANSNINKQDWKLPETTLDEPAGARTVHVGDKDIPDVWTRLRFTTMIVLPKDEQILDYVCGDKEFWVINGNQNFAFVKPAKQAARTNLNLITASGNVYSFTLAEVGEARSPDLKLFVEPKGEGLLSALKNTPRFVPMAALDDYRTQVVLAQAEASKAKSEAAKAISAAEEKARKDLAMAKAGIPQNLLFDYQYKDQAGFNVAAMYHDDKFTYIRAKPDELPALYEEKDGKPSWIQFAVNDGLYTAPKILDDGYLQIGKRKLRFNREK